jgi:hypothetical protein|tara:strand:+ start:1638 stop:2126 length:489 start_codon:yes stop_codon:yes gene_type:complete
MPKQKITLTDEQKNISKQFLLCNYPKCMKNDDLPALVSKLCPFCYKVGYCCTVCLNKDIGRHLENDCQKNFNANTSTSDKTDKIEKTNNIELKAESKHSNSKNGFLRFEKNVNVNDYISGSEESSEYTDDEKHRRNASPKSRFKPSSSSSAMSSKTKITRKK